MANLTKDTREKIWADVKFARINEQQSYDMCRKPFPGVDSSNTNEFTIKKYNLCENDLTIGHPIPKLGKTENIVVENADGVKQSFITYKTGTSRTWKILLVIYWILIIFGDIPYPAIITWFDPTIGLIIDIALSLFGFFLFGPLMLIGLVEALPEIFFYVGLGDMPINLFEIIPIHIIILVIRYIQKSNKEKVMRNAYIAADNKYKSDINNIELTDIYDIVYSNDLFNIPQDEWIEKGSSIIEERKKIVHEGFLTGQPTVSVTASKKII